MRSYINKIISWIFYLSFSLIISLLISCSQRPISIANKEKISPQQYLHIAENYINKANNTTDNASQQDYKLKACENYILAIELIKAENIINTISFTNQEQEAYFYILQAKLALQKHLFTSAQQYLQNIWTPKQLSIELQQKFYLTRAELSEHLGNLIATIKDHIKLEQLLFTDEDKQTEIKAIWSILTKLTPQELQQQRSKSNEPDIVAWLTIAHIMKQYNSDSEQMLRAVTVWQQQYPTHPANKILPPQLQQEKASLLEEYLPNNNPQHIALLLPLKGQYAATAEIIRDGFLTAHYLHCKANNCNTKVTIYDTSKKLTSAYKMAINSQADVIVGPLTKNDVEKITNRANKNIPILALNTTPSNSSAPKANIFQFGLTPETEINEVANHVWDDGHRKILFLVQAGNWGDRIIKHFRQIWEQYGGTILAAEKINPKDDLNTKIRKALAIIDPAKPAKNATLTHHKINLKPTRRQDIDAIIIATNPELARQLKPLLNFYYAGNIPTYAHSSIYSGKVSAIQDQDLNDIIFCDMPWLLDPSITSHSIYKNIATLWPNKLATSPRLYAFGIDAYKLSNQLPQLLTLTDIGISGMTGILTLDQQHRIQRKLTWAKFNNGIAKLLSTK